MNVNTVIVGGRLCAEPRVVKITAESIACNIRLAINRKYRDRSGQAKEEATFVDCVIWNKQAEVAGKYLKKGSNVLITGRLHLDTWEQDGQNRSRLVVWAERFDFIDPKTQTHGANDGKSEIPF